MREPIEFRFISGRDGNRLRTAVFEPEAGRGERGVCVLLSGQTEFIEKYSEVIGELCARGFRVATLDWRGQGASRRALPEPLKARIGDFAEYDEDLCAFMDMVVRPLGSAKPIALAHSMGGHILLRALHSHSQQFAAAVFSAPMIRAQTRGYNPLLARAVCYLQNLTGHANDWVWGMDKRDPLYMSFSDQLVTSDAARWQRTQDIIESHPEIRLAGPTWGWLEAAYRSMASVCAPGFPEAILTPVLICGGGKDRIVETAATAGFARRLPHGAYLQLDDSEHEILMEQDDIRAEFWAAFDAFVNRYAPA